MGPAYFQGFFRGFFFPSFCCIETTGSMRPPHWWGLGFEIANVLLTPGGALRQLTLSTKLLASAFDVVTFLHRRNFMVWRLRLPRG